MAYNGFTATYQPMFYQPQYQPQFQQQTPTQPAPAQQNIIWVQGEAAARGYLMAPNTTLPLWDSESNTIFLKTTDAAGMPSMKVLDYTIRDTTPANAPVAASAAQGNNSPAYATKADVDALTARIDALSAEVNGRKGAALNE